MRFIDNGFTSLEEANGSIFQTSITGAHFKFILNKNGDACYQYCDLKGNSSLNMYGRDEVHFWHSKSMYNFVSIMLEKINNEYILVSKASDASLSLVEIKIRKIYNKQKSKFPFLCEY